MKIKLREGWLVKDMANSFGGDANGDQWKFTTDKPDFIPEVYDCKASTCVPGEVKRIMYVEVDD